MILVNLDHIIHRYGATPVLDGACWEIHQGRKIGLVGANGAGKSTLLKIIAGEIRPDDGNVYCAKGSRIGYLAQEPRLGESNTIWDEVVGANTELARMSAELSRLESEMAANVSHARLMRVADAYDRKRQVFEEAGGYAHEARVRGVLHSLGFEESDFCRRVADLSGGQAKLVGIANLLSSGADLLLLDEPDNHLDLAAKAMLEEFIRGFPGTIVIVSHDRYLLDAVVDEIAEVEDLRTHVYPGTYTQYAVEKELRLLRQQQMYQAQQKEIARIESAIARFEEWASIVVNERHARQARSRRKMLDRMDRVDAPTLERRMMALDLGGWRGSNKVLDIAELDKAFGDQLVLEGLNLTIWRGQRVGLLGANGAGKSVLIRCILGQEELTGGVIRLGPSVRIGYYAQRHETLDPDKTLIEEVRQVRQMYEDQAVSFLGGLLFPYEMTRKRVRDLSGGERSRLQLAKLMLSGANFLLLDEPTNNLDLPSCEVLEQSLDRFEGTVLVVSHDRYLLDRVVDRIIELDDGTLAEYPGDYTAYREQKERRASA